ncbi:hypothetical protein [Psychromonas aquatilis]|uniref:Uracil DNA glycosylase superfamily protein n=1 Tax=Psychromonas aquatilis TaxID=2005072 RepID=A0ABU9GU90_9GAMM
MSCHISIGTESKIAFVFSCPGRNELEAGYPAAKATGTNLSLFLSKLSAELSYGALTRKKITITNAWDKVEYEELTKRSEATSDDIKGTLNIQRLSKELENISDLIVCCGDKALLAVNECALKTKPKVVTLKHLGNKGLNSIKFDLNGKEILSAKKARELGDKRSAKIIGKENTALRLQILSKNIANQIKI